jgi:hypothetical protein
MKDLFKAITRYSGSVIIGAVTAPLLVYTVRKMEKEEQDKLLWFIISSLNDYPGKSSIPNLSNLKAVFVRLNKDGFGPQAADDPEKVEAARQRLLAYLKQDGDVCLCPSCIGEALTGTGEKSPHATN